MYMIKITGVLAVMIGVVGLLDSWKKTMAQQKMKTPVFFDGVKGENEYFTKICRKISQDLIEHKYPQGAECWDMAWKKELNKYGFDSDTKRIINESGKYFFEISPDEMEERLLEYNRALEKKIENETLKYQEKRKVVYPVGMLGGIMLVIILL